MAAMAKIKHRGNMYILAYISETIAFLTWHKIVNQVKISMPSNVQMNRTTGCCVAPSELVLLLLGNFAIFGYYFEYYHR